MDQFTLIAAIVGYFCGSLPFGLLLTRFAGLGDIRGVGSGNIGATNVLRTGNKKLAALTLALDALKGLVPVLVFGYLTAEPNSPPSVVAGLSAFFGHLYPVWLRFKGGKGVATYLGVTAGFSLLALFVFAATWLLTAYLTKFSSLAALVATVSVTLAMFAFTDLPLGVLYLGLAVLIFWKHRENISRLLAGTESRIGAK
ncbi:MAG: glycerol-3-phosphate 1-O-acyltransferase PlsY [Pseudomonadota bacterium]